MNEVKAAKHLGQHFLRDEAVIARLLAVINAHPGERILEIGPGLGALTLPLLRQTGALTAVEYDPRVLAPLAKKAAPLGTLHLIHADILDIDFGNMLPPPVGDWNSSSEGRESWGGGSKQPAPATSTPPFPRGGGAGGGVSLHTAAAEPSANMPPPPVGEGQGGTHEKGIRLFRGNPGVGFARIPPLPNRPPNIGCALAHRKKPGQ